VTTGASEPLRPEHLATAGDLAELRNHLDLAGLPSVDIDWPGRRFFRFAAGGVTVGYSGLEGTAPDILLRSIVVAAHLRGKGYGRGILHAVEEEAAAIGCERLHLLTETATAFFRRHGYRDGDRQAAPESVAGSAEFTALCPSTAAYLVKKVSVGGGNFGC